MQDKELLNLWKSYDQKLEEVLSLNQKMVSHITKEKLNRTVSTMQWPKRAMLLIGIPYTLVLYFITFIALQAGAFFVALGFGGISIIMTGIIAAYGYHLYLIQQINRSQEVVDVQAKIAQLKISTFNTTRLAVIQLPFWSVCWINLNALKSTPILYYGGVNFLVFLGLSYLAYWIYSSLDIQNNDSKVSQFFLSGKEWEPILKASEILEQLKEYDH